MSGLLATISGQFSKSLILGAFFPAVVFVTLAQILLTPLLPDGAPWTQVLSSLDPQWQVVAVSLVAFVVAGLLYNLNTAIIRVYEGYPWRNSSIGRWRSGVYAARLTSLQVRRDALFALDTPSPASEAQNEASQVLQRIWLELAGAYPSQSRLILPTRLGNAIRSFEEYPKLQYGMDAITLFPRLVASIDPGYAGSVDDAKTSFDFLLNCSSLSSLLSLGLLMVGLLYPAVLSAPDLWVPWLLEIVLFAALAYLFYQMSIGRAIAWGAMVKGAFDLYRWDLLKRLGYADAPREASAEAALWGTISKRLLFGPPPERAVDVLPPYRSPQAKQATGASGTPVAPSIHPQGLVAGGGGAGCAGGEHLTATREIPVANANGLSTVQITVTNVIQHVVQNVWAWDRIAPGFSYVEGSAKVGARAVMVRAGAGLSFQIGALGAAEQAVLSYQLRATSPIPLDVTRGVMAGHDAASVVVVLRVRHTGLSRVTGATVTDGVPEGFDPVWESATLDGTRIQFTGAGSISFGLGDFDPAHQEKEVRYTILARVKRGQ